MLGFMAQSSIIEISSRGIRVIKRVPGVSYLKEQAIAHDAPSTNCIPTYEMLCSIEEKDRVNNSTYINVVLPSSKVDAKFLQFNEKSYTLRIVSGLSSLIENKLLQRFVQDSKHACGLHGQGRQFNDDVARFYTISACDIIHGRVYIAYDVVEETLTVFNETFGETAYFTLLVISIVCLYGISGSIYDKDNSSLYQVLFSGINISTSVSLCLGYAVHGFPFVTYEDEIVFFISIAACLMYTICSLFWNSLHVQDACIFNLASICMSVYKTCENPYTYFFVFGIMIKTWGCILKTCDCKLDPVIYESLSVYLNLIIYSVVISLFTEYGIKPEFENRQEDWVVYSGILLFISFHISLILK